MAAQRIPDHAKTSVALIESMGFQVYLNSNFPLPNPGIPGVQVRHNPSPKSEVNRYVAAIQNGDRFPPIVVTEDGYVVDGNTRVSARAKLDHPYVEALVLDVKKEPRHERNLTILAAAFNARNGRSITQDEIDGVLEKLTGGEERNAETVARQLGIKPSQVTAYFAVNQALKRFERIGLPMERGPRWLIRLGHAASWMHDAPFRGISELCRDVDLGSRDLEVLIKRVKKATSDEEALAIISEERKARKEQIRQYKVTGRKPIPPWDGKLRQSMGVVLNHSKNLGDFVDRNVYTCEASLDRLNKYAALIAIIINHQSGYNGERRAA